MKQRTAARLSAGLGLIAATLVPATAISTAPPASAGGGLQKPLGFERWEDPEPSCPGYSSSLGFNMSPSSIVADYAAYMTIGLPGDSPAYKQKGKRLIDIEVHADGSGLANYVWDIVWVCNNDDFELESWFVPSLTEQEVKWMDELPDIVIADIERYPKGADEFQFAAIVQRNSGKFETRVLLDTNVSVTQTIQRRMNGRVLDVDWNEYPCPPGSESNQACPNILDAVLVENTGSNFVSTVGPVWGNDGLATPPGFQISDLEHHVDAPVVTIWTQSSNPYFLMQSPETGTVVFNHEFTGRIVDIEIEEHPQPSGVGFIPNYHTVHVTNQ